MSLVIELPKDVELSLREQAQQAGKALNQYIAGILREKTRPNPATPRLSAAESDLFTTINQGFDETFWTRLHALNEKRKTGNMHEFDEEHQELIAMTDQLETVNVARTKALIELAALRQTDFLTLSNQLGIPAVVN
jgi:hypothetical protein